MFALVIFILTFITTMSHMIGQQVDVTTQNVSGGYSVIVESNASSPIAPRTIRKRPGVWGVAALYPTTAGFTAAGFDKDTPWPLTAFDNSLLDAAPPHLEDRGRYTTDREAWLAVLHDPNLIVVDAFFLQTGGGPPGETVGVGDGITFTDPFSGRSRAVTVAAVATTDAIVQNGAMYGIQGARAVFGDRLVPTRSYVALRSGVDAEHFAARIQGDFAERGAEANSIRSLMDESFAMTNRIFLLFEGYLAMGLIVGIAGLAVVMVRAVRERRREIGTLRALGFQPRAVGAAFAVESGFIALEGTVLGVGLALVTLYNIVARSDAMGDYTGFSVPWATLAVLLVGTVFAALVATIGPAASASRIRPAVALRTDT
jgi:putative ABC transport system permease protein